MVIYEVNCLVQAVVKEAFSEWLPVHVTEVTAIDGFLDAEIWQLLEDDQLDKEKGVTGFSVRYRLSDQAALDNYLLNHAPALRQDGLDRFGGQFTVYRRVLTSVTIDGKH